MYSILGLFLNRPPTQLVSLLRTAKSTGRQQDWKSFHMALYDLLFPELYAWAKTESATKAERIVSAVFEKMMEKDFFHGSFDNDEALLAHIYRKLKL
jgi:hypothetical protein